LAPIYSQMIMRRRGKFANEKVHVAGATGESKDETCEQGDVDATLESERANNTVVDIDSDTDLATSDKVGTGRKAFTYSKKIGALFFGIFLILLAAAVLVRTLVPSSMKAEYGYLVATFYFVGSIIFGGGPVIIPLLKTYTVDSGWMTDQQFLVGLALIQSLPGPNFNFACFLGAVAMVNANGSGIAGAILCYLAIFFPGIDSQECDNSLLAVCQGTFGGEASLSGCEFLCIRLGVFGHLVVVDSDKFHGRQQRISCRDCKCSLCGLGLLGYACTSGDSPRRRDGCHRVCCYVVEHAPA